MIKRQQLTTYRKVIVHLERSHFQSARLEAVFLAALLPLVTLFDWYYEGIGRVFDCLWLGLVVPYLVLRREFSVFGLATVLGTLLLSVGGLYSAIETNYLATIAGYSVFGVAAMSYMRAVYKRVSPELLAKVVHITMALHLLAWCIQGVGILSGVFIQLMPTMSGFVQPRNAHYIRCSGMFLEPNSYCVVMGYLMVLQYFSGARSTLALVLRASIAVSMIFSFSLWGAAAAAYLFGILLPGRLLLKVVSGAALLIGSFVFVASARFDEIAAKRIADVLEGNDISLSVRYGDGSSLKMISFFGTHFGTDVLAKEESGMNMAHWFLVNQGVVSSGVLLCIFLFRVNRDLAIKIAFIPVLLTQYPVVAYALFWVFYGFCVESRLRCYQSRWFATASLGQGLVCHETVSGPSGRLQ